MTEGQTAPARIRLHRLGRGADDPVDALSLARVLLDEVRAGQRPGVLRIYRPEPTVAFGARDRFLPGFPAAVEAARAHGFTPVLRSLGGRVAPYHRGSLVIDHIEPASTLLSGTQGRFTDFGAMYAQVLRSLGIDARLGEIPGEYCPGEHSVNVAGRIKAIGTAQRVTAAGWLFSSSIVVTDPDPIRAVLTDVEAALGIEWDPATGGSISEVHPEVTVEEVAEAFDAAYGTAFEVVAGQIDVTTLAAAAEYRGKHEL
nr:lipoate--protein ligase family protein [Brevibacterium luteolum]